MMLKIKTVSGKVIEIEVDSEDTVKELKQRIEEVERIPPVQQKLIFNGAIFTNDEKKLGDYNLKNGNVVHMVLALRGG
ncbi:hypothetical protein EDEG_01876 [Edhazardia aedis USNM 41457]|uniref:Ubiquitin-like domain-containing protein n=1 Tax=Edhazardia aedis (strain USNM 41457) TaxID=1003232 RepID=J9DR62_EDHAE|nr:hypothetical protein EDEG_01876 [Edhazardia aedis USNM 41457]|eukprot:EJW03832.1 hypothetical protein EDEG_01876 [Edhazardia aedis USNM 41457]